MYIHICMYIYMYILGGPIRALPMRAQGAHKGLAHKGPGGPTRPWPTRAQGGQPGPGPQRPRVPQGQRPQGPWVAHKGLAHKGRRGPTRTQPTRAHGAHKGLVHKGTGRPTRAWPTRAQGIVALWHGHRARAKATTRIVVHKSGEIARSA